MINFVISNILIYTKLQVHCFSLCLPDLMSSKMTNHTFFSKSNSEIAHWLSWTIKVNKKYVLLLIFSVIQKCVLLLVSSYNKSMYFCWFPYTIKQHFDWFPHTAEMCTFTGFLIQVEMYTFSFFRTAFAPWRTWWKWTWARTNWQSCPWTLASWRTCSTWTCWATSWPRCPSPSASSTSWSGWTWRTTHWTLAWRRMLGTAWMRSSVAHAHKG